MTNCVWDVSYNDALIARCRDVDRDGDCSDAGETLYYTFDANHNVTALVDGYDGQVVERYVFDPYGRATICDAAWVLQPDAPDANTVTGDESLFGNEILYCGYRYDGESALGVTSVPVDVSQRE